jgi:hypothetical protein
LANIVEIHVTIDGIYEASVQGCPYVLLVMTKVVEAILVGCSPHVNQVLLEETASTEQEREFIRPVLNTVRNIISLREAVFFRGGHLEIIVVSIFSVYEEERILKTLIHRGSIADTLEWAILEMDDNIAVAI